MLTRSMINDSVNDTIDTNKKSKARSLYFNVWKGNYPKNIKDGFSDRSGWSSVSKKEWFDKANFIWKPTNFRMQVGKLIL